MIHLVTDTTAYLPEEIRARWNIHIVPLKITTGTQTFDEDKVKMDEFFQHLAQVKTTPTTSQPAPGEFIQLYESLTRNGDEVLSIHISGAISGTTLVAQMAAQAVAPDRITVVDSRSATCPMATMVLLAAQALASGAGREQAVALVQHLAQHHEGIFTVGSLDYLAKGGRINGAARFLGNVLNLRPILYLHEGKIEGLAVARTRKRAVGQVLDEMEKRVGVGAIHAAVTHIQCADQAAELAEMVRARFQCADLLLTETGPVIGSHVGPGFIGFSACPVAA